MTATIRHAAGFVLYADEPDGRRYLLLRNARHGTWGFPKGHRDPGEDDFACAHRELEEETGLTRIEIIPGFDRTERYHLPDKDAVKVVRYFAARLLEGEPRLSPEHSEGGFCSIDEALGKMQHASLRDVLAAVDAFLDESPRA